MIQKSRIGSDRSIDANEIRTDVLVVGAGGAGCQAAMAAADSGASVILVDKGRLGVTANTFDPFTWGKGIIAAAEGFNPTHDPNVHFREAMAVSGGLADPKLVRIVAEEAPVRFRELLEMGVPFKSSRVGSCFGETMRGIVVEQPKLADVFREQVARRPIRLLQQTMVTGLLMREGVCAGAVCLTPQAGILVCRAKSVVLACGGASSMFRYSFTAPAISGDGYVLALQAGAELTNLEFYQAILGTTEPARVFFPQWFLAGKPPFYNRQKHPFLSDYLPASANVDALVMDRSKHGPFSFDRQSGKIDVAIDAEIRHNRGTTDWGDDRYLAGVWCDFSSVSKEQRKELDQRFLPALTWLKTRGLDFESQPMPIASFAHAFNGGVVIDEDGDTGVPGLFACGEVAAGPHGANRLGGHMFAVLLVFGRRAGQSAARRAVDVPLPVPDEGQVRAEIERIATLSSSTYGQAPHEFRRRIQWAMAPIMIAKDEASLAQTQATLDDIRESTSSDYMIRSRRDLATAISAANLLDVATLVTASATKRQESRGPHYRTDHPFHVSPSFDRLIVWKIRDGVRTAYWRNSSSASGCSSSTPPR